MEKTVLLSMIQECIRQGKAVVGTHVMPKHGGEGFTVRQGIESILAGEIIEVYPDRDRVLICGQASGVKIDKRFVGNYIHSSVRIEWNMQAQQVVVVTMYRPDGNNWKNQYTRK